MKKTLIASAVAMATLASTGAMAAEMNLPKVYGNIQLAIAQDNTEYSYTDGTVNDSSYELFDNGSTIGFSHEHEIMPGLTGFLKAEFEFDADRQKGPGNGLNRGDQAFIGVKGDFGTVKVGSYDTIYDDAINDAVSDVFEVYGGGDSTNTTDEGDTITYYSPSMGGLTVAASLQVNGEGDQSKLAAQGEPKNAALAVISYEMDQTSIALGWDSGDNSDSHSAYGLAITQGLGDLNLGFSYETQEDYADIYAVRATVAMGANQFIALYKYSDFDDVTGRDTGQYVALQALHNLSDNMYVYVEGQWYTDDAKGDEKSTDMGFDADGDPIGNGDVESTGIAVGATYVF